MSSQPSTPTHSQTVLSLQADIDALSNATSAAELTATQTADMRERAAEATRRSRTFFSAVVASLGPLGLASGAVLLSVILCALVAPAERWTSWGLPLALGLAPVWGLFAWRAAREQDVRDLAYRVTELTTALYPQWACKAALQLVNEFEAACALRDKVVARGEELQVFHYRAMESLVHEQRLAERDAENRWYCRQLHGLPL